MSCKSRICGLLGLGLGKHLSLTFTICENLTRPGASALLPEDRLRVCAWAANGSSIPLCRIRGRIEPSPRTRFVPLPFEVARLEPGGKVACARPLQYGAPRKLRDDKLSA
jgi:hypothetical protein